MGTGDTRAHGHGTRAAEAGVGFCPGCRHAAGSAAEMAAAFGGSQPELTRALKPGQYTVPCISCAA
jgi:hypothetical protein